MNIESYATINENAKIQGVALIPRISRNNNLYTKEELARFHGKKVPLNWEHNGDKVIGEVTFQYDPTSETVYYEGVITDPSAALLAKNKLLYTSIEATPTAVKQVCNGGNDCFHMPFGLVPEALALTETPGVPETSVNVFKESILQTISKCKEHTEADHEFVHKYGASEIIHKTIKPREEAKPCWDGYKQVGMKMQDGKEVPNCVPETHEADDCVQKQISKLSDEHPEWKHDQVIAVAYSKCGLSKESSVDNIIQANMTQQVKDIEAQIKAKNDALELFTKVMANNEDPLLHDYIALLKQDVEFLSNQLIGLRKDSEYVSMESLDSMVSNMKERYICDCCGDIKKKLT